MKSIFRIIILVFSISTNAQINIKKITATNPYQKKIKYEFPFIVSNANKKAAEKINDSLTLDFLDINRKKVKKSIFENVWGKSKDDIIPMSDVSYKVLYNSGNIISLSINAEGCGAYCESFTRYFSYNTKTGNKIRITDLLNKSGLKLLTDSILARKQKTLENKLQEIEDSLETASVQANNDSKEYFLQMKELYENCRTESVQLQINYFEFYLTKTQLFFITDRCSAHYNRAVDELDNFTFAFFIKEWNQFLTPVGRKIIFP